MASSGMNGNLKSFSPAQCVCDAEMGPIFAAAMVHANGRARAVRVLETVLQSSRVRQSNEGSIPRFNREAADVRHGGAHERRAKFHRPGRE